MSQDLSSDIRHVFVSDHYRMHEGVEITDSLQDHSHAGELDVEWVFVRVITIDMNAGVPFASGGGSEYYLDGDA